MALDTTPRREAPRMHVGWRDDYHPDKSLNFQINRWVCYGGPSWFEPVRPLVPQLTSYDAWKTIFLELGEKALADGRNFHAALNFRSAEFFMTFDDPRKQPTRKKLLSLFRAESGVPESACRWIDYEGAKLPAWPFIPVGPSKGTIVLFGGFDSYIEEFFPFLSQMRDDGWTIIAFEGPGQGTPLEDSKTVITPDWHRPVAAVLDEFKLDDVTLVGISLGGCLVMRAAAGEPRVRRVVAWDILSDFFACTVRSFPPPLLALVNGATDAAGKAKLDAAIGEAMKTSFMLEWLMKQGFHVLGCKTPSEMFELARAYHTRDVSPQITQDVLLMAGSRDHYVPLEQVYDQARMLTSARSVTARVFTPEEYADMHCQLGNFPLAVRLIENWIEERSLPPSPVG